MLYVQWAQKSWFEDAGESVKTMQMSGLARCVFLSRFFGCTLPKVEHFDVYNFALCRPIVRSCGGASERRLTQPQSEQLFRHREGSDRRHVRRRIKSRPSEHRLDNGHRIRFGNLLAVCNPRGASVAVNAGG